MNPAHWIARRSQIAMLAGAGWLIVAVSAMGQTQPQATPLSPGPLQQLSNETQQIYQRVRADVIRVKLPASLWMAQVRQQQRLELHRYLERWGNELQPEVRQQLMSHEEQLAAPPTTQPQARINGQAFAVSPVATALLIDDKGHAMMPVYVDPRAAAKIVLPVLIGNVQRAGARVIGSDADMNLSVLQIQPMSADTSSVPLPAPAILSTTRPEEGQLVLLLSLDSGGRLILWDTGRFDPGLAVMSDGSVAGFCFNNQFLAASVCRPIVDQLIATGAVHRASLGVWVREVRRDDPLRQQIAPLGNRHGVFVDQVVPGSPAQRDGILAGDVILSAGGEPVEDRATLAEIMATHSGATDLQILRGSESMTITVNLQPQ